MILASICLSHDPRLATLLPPRMGGVTVNRAVSLPPVGNRNEQLTNGPTDEASFLRARSLLYAVWCSTGAVLDWVRVGLGLGGIVVSGPTHTHTLRNWPRSKCHGGVLASLLVSFQPPPKMLGLFLCRIGDTGWRGLSAAIPGDGRDVTRPSISCFQH